MALVATGPLLTVQYILTVICQNPAEKVACAEGGLKEAKVGSKEAYSKELAIAFLLSFKLPLKVILASKALKTCQLY